MGSDPSIIILDGADTGWLDVDLRHVPERRLRGATPPGLEDLLARGRRSVDAPERPLRRLGVIHTRVSRPLRLLRVVQVRKRENRELPTMTVADLLVNMEIPTGADVFVQLPTSSASVDKWLRRVGALELIVMDGEAYDELLAISR